MLPPRTDGSSFMLSQQIGSIHETSARSLKKRYDDNKWKLLSSEVSSALFILMSRVQISAYPIFYHGDCFQGKGRRNCLVQWTLVSGLKKFNSWQMMSASDLFSWKLQKKSFPSKVWYFFLERWNKLKFPTMVRTSLLFSDENFEKLFCQVVKKDFFVAKIILFRFLSCLQI